MVKNKFQHSVYVASWIEQNKLHNSWALNDLQLLKHEIQQIQHFSGKFSRKFAYLRNLLRAKSTADSKGDNNNFALNIKTWFSVNVSAFSKFLVGIR